MTAPCQCLVPMVVPVDAPRRRLRALGTALRVLPCSSSFSSSSAATGAGTAGAIYDQLGVHTIINANGPSTRVSGGLPRREVIEAMASASERCVDIAHLQAGRRCHTPPACLPVCVLLVLPLTCVCVRARSVPRYRTYCSCQGRASELIAEVTGAESGYVTAGAACGLMLGTAACITGLDPVKMNQLPDMSGLKNEVIIARSHRNFYDKAVRSVGVEIVEVGLSDRHAGAGVRDTEAWEIAAAIGPRTALVLYTMNPGMQPPLQEVLAVAHRAGVPVLVDAAAQALPPSNLKHFVAMGADLVVFSVSGVAWLCICGGPWLRHVDSLLDRG